MRRLRWPVTILVAVSLAWVGLVMSDHVVNNAAPANWDQGVNSPVAPPPQVTPKVAAHLDALYGTPCGSRLFANCANGDIGVAFRPADVRAWEYDVWASGSFSTGAYYECAWQSAYVLDLVYYDCDFLLTYAESYAAPLMNLAAAWNVGIDFQWTNPSNQYVGWFTF